MGSKPGEYGIEQAFSRAWFTPGYWKTLARLLRPARPEIAVQGASLRFTRYPFEPASIFPDGAVEAAQVAEVNLSYPADQVRLESGDILFVPPPGKAALLAWVNQNEVRVERRSSIWRGLLDPFLDTWEDQESIDYQFDAFAKLGLGRDKVDAWRREVAVAMIAYNFGTRLWEWTILDLYDVLVAQRARLSRANFADFYRRAIELAALDPPRESVRPGAGHGIADALFAVLVEWYPQGEFDARSGQIRRLQAKLAAELTAAYTQPSRRYHTAAHIQSCLEELAGVWDYAVHLDEVRWALVFHDAIYDPRRQDNEARSADWACSVMDELRRPEEQKARVRAMILATAHAGEPRTPDEALLLDIDLSILGAGDAEFDEYDRAIRVEYDWVPEPEYRQARARLLESFLSRERIYRTAAYRAREPLARRNIERALLRLRGV